jgi:NAD(P)-dependent dehydrogenase (short-subunit alcohol dehydrogenase family)
MTFETTTDEVLRDLRLDDEVVLVTGASTGLGLETARALAAAGAVVLLGVRSEEKGKAAAAAVSERVAEARVEHVVVDLASLASVRAAAASVLARQDRIDVLVNNAGVMYTPYGRTEDGFEVQLGTNYLGHFLLSALLLPALLKAAPARVVNLSSSGHRSSDIVWDDPNYERRPYDKFAAYGQSKTANILFSRELDRRFAPHGLHSFAVHPGIIKTELARHITPEDMAELRELARLSPGGPLPSKSVEAGAATTVWAAVAPELNDHGGAYLVDCEVSDDDAPWTRNAGAAARLWSLSEELVGQHWPPS